VDVRDLISPRLHLEIETPNGRFYRWGPHEDDVRDRVMNVEFGTSMPGGHREMSCRLMRRINETYGDLTQFSRVRLYGPGDRTVWSGRIAETPRTHGDEFTITVNCVGDGAHLKDNATFREIYVDRDLNSWTTSPSRSRQITRLNAGELDTGWGTEIAPDETTGKPALIQKTESITASPGAFGIPAWASSGETWYHGGGVRIARVWIDHTDYTRATGSAHGDMGSPSPTNGWLADLRFATTDNGPETTAASCNPSTQAYVSSGTFDARYAFLLVRFMATSTASYNGEFAAIWANLAVYGQHGLPLVGTADPKGVLASDVVKDVVQRAAPRLTATSTTVPASSYPIPHLVFKEAVTPEDAILAVNRFELRDWFVYDDKLFWYMPPGTYGRVWQVRMADGAHLAEEGPQAETSYNGIIGSYQNTEGVRKMVGPIGSVADNTDATLGDASPTNPANQAGLTRYFPLDMGTVGSTTDAIQIAAAFFRQIQAANVRGNVTVVGPLIDADGVWHPPWAVRAGDRVQVMDAADTSERKITETKYSHDAQQITMTVDTTPHRVEALLERIQADLVGLI
jgi:hypothetical protein